MLTIAHKGYALSFNIYINLIDGFFESIIYFTIVRVICRDWKTKYINGFEFVFLLKFQDIVKQNAVRSCWRLFAFSGRRHISMTTVKPILRTRIQTVTFQISHKIQSRICFHHVRRLSRHFANNKLPTCTPNSSSKKKKATNSTRFGF